MCDIKAFSKDYLPLLILKGLYPTCVDPSLVKILYILKKRGNLVHGLTKDFQPSVT